MKLNFHTLQTALLTQFSENLEGKELYYIDLPERNTLVDTYLASFPDGTNPIYRERTEHDCNCCRSFIRQYGNMVTISEDGNITSLWDMEVGCPSYQVVVDAMSKELHKYEITNVFRAESKRCGTESNVELLEDGSTHKHDHFFLDLPQRYVLSPELYSSQKGVWLADKEVLERSLSEISVDAVDIVIDIVEQGSLYRGEEHLHTVKRLKGLIKEFESSDINLNLFCWLKASEIGSAGRIRNTVIGTLLIDITAGVDLETAVKKYEVKVAPSNYKRPKALVTQGMVDAAQKTIDELGLNNSFSRRFANASDLTINNVLFADSDVQPTMSGGVFDAVKVSKKSTNMKLDKVEEISIEDFMNKVLPNASSIEAMVENKHTSNFMSVIAPVNKDAPNITKWGNPFTWSYNGEVTDSMKEQVKAAGGSVTGDLRFSIKWNDEYECSSDLDAHCITASGKEIYYGDKRDGKGGKLDVDIMSPRGVAVENITFDSRTRMVDGDYKFYVNNFSKRSGRSAFTAQIEFDGQIVDFIYDKDLSGKVHVATVNLKKGVFTLKESKIPSSSTSKEVWGVNTLQFTPVEMVLNSPNHWDDEETGNKHYFFILKDCINPDDARGFYNEFLRDDLTKHRKAFEILSSKLKAPTCNDQLSGVGFSSTQRNELVVKVTGSFNRVLKIKF